MSDDRQKSETAEQLDERDPLDRIEPDEGDEQRVEQAWEETDVGEGEAPSG